MGIGEGVQEGLNVGGGGGGVKLEVAEVVSNSINYPSHQELMSPKQCPLTALTA